MIKATFHRYIVELGYTHIIPYYDKIFNDKIYINNNVNNSIIHPLISAEWMSEKIKEYQAKQLQIERRKISKRAPVVHKVNSYVGCRDKEGKWWLSKILAIFYKDIHTIYYVEFLNWGEQFNEFITDPARIQIYNSHRHHLFKPVEI